MTYINREITNTYWCSECNRALEWREVTFEETHDEHVGGCGHAVSFRASKYISHEFTARISWAFAHWCWIVDSQVGENVLVNLNTDYRGRGGLPCWVSMEDLARAIFTPPLETERPSLCENCGSQADKCCCHAEPFTEQVRFDNPPWV